MTKKKLIILSCIVVAVTLLVLGIRLAGSLLPGNSTADYNTYATERAWAQGNLRSNEILLLKSLSRSDGNTTAEFGIYAMPSGSSAKDYIAMKASELPADTRLELMGSATCVFKNDDPANIVGLTTMYLR